MNNCQNLELIQIFKTTKFPIIFQFQKERIASDNCQAFKCKY